MSLGSYFVSHEGVWHRAVGKSLDTDCGVPLSDEIMQTQRTRPPSRAVVCTSCTTEQERRKMRWKEGRDVASNTKKRLRVKDHVGRRVALLRDIKTRNGNVFKAGEIMKCVGAGVRNLVLAVIDDDDPRGHIGALRREDVRVLDDPPATMSTLEYEPNDP